MTPQELECRRPIWQALSALYLDTELISDQIEEIALACKHSGFSLDKLRAIDYYEVAPLVGRNLLSPAGEWTGFESAWLFQNCEANYVRRNQFFYKLKCHLLNGWIHSTRKSNWKSLAKGLVKN